MAESRSRAKFANAQPEGQSQTEPAGGELDPTSDQISDATTDPPVAEKDAAEQSQPPPEDSIGENADTDDTTTPEKQSEAGGSSVQEVPDTIAGLLQSREFVEQMADAMFRDGKAAERLLTTLSERLQERIEDDPEFERMLLTRAMANPTFRGRVVKALANALS